MIRKDTDYHFKNMNKQRRVIFRKSSVGKELYKKYNEKSPTAM
jgi:hypothetical protein